MSTNPDTGSRGALIVLEGLDRSGKTTQSKMLLEYLRSQGKAARIQRFPDRSETNTGPVIDNFLRNAKTADQDSEAIHLLFSANRWFLAQKVRDDLASGVHVIADRYSFSGIAYSLAKGLDKTWVCAPELCLPRPDVVLFLDIGPAAAAARDGYGNEVLERTAFQHAVYDHMKGILNESYCQNVNASVAIEQVHASITEKIEKTLEAVADGMQLGSFTPTDFGI